MALRFEVKYSAINITSPSVRSVMEYVVQFVILVFSIIAVIVVWSGFYWASRRRLWALAEKIPGPKPLPIIGNGLLLWGCSVTDTYKIITAHYEKYGSFFRMWLGDYLMVMMSDPEDIKKVLGNTRIMNRSNKTNQAITPFFGKGLLSSEDEEWRIHRKLITPMFHFKKLESYVNIFGQKAEILVEKLNKMADGRTFDIYNYLSLCTLDAICETAIGSPVETQRSGNSEYREALASTAKLILNRMMKPWLLIKWLYPLTSDGRSAKLAMQAISDFTQGVIERKLQDYRRGNRCPGFVTPSGKTITSFLDMMIEASETQGSILSPQEMQDEVTTMTSAGLETTATAMSFFLVLIAIHPEIQDQIVKELDGIFGDDKRSATSDDINNMQMLHRGLQESLRLFPVASVLVREITEDVTLPKGEIIPRGCSVMIYNFAVHRLPKYYPDPNKYWPDRWLPENMSEHASHPYAYLPFGAGLRNCIGQKYAFVQMKSILSTILRRFKVKTHLVMEDLYKLELCVTINLGHNNYKVQLEKRKTDER